MENRPLGERAADGRPGKLFLLAGGFVVLLLLKRADRPRTGDAAL